MRFSDEDFIYRILGVDNGSGHLGCAVLDLDLRTGVFTLVHSVTFVASKLLDDELGVATSCSDRLARQFTLARAFADYLEWWSPHSVAIEAPFFMPGRVSTFETLTEMYLLLRDVAVRHMHARDVVRVRPGEAKAAVLDPSKFTMKKAVIRDCVIGLDYLVVSEGINIEALSEHEYDAIAVAICNGKWLRRDLRF